MSDLELAGRCGEIALSAALSGIGAWWLWSTVAPNAVAVGIAVAFAMVTVFVRLGLLAGKQL